MVVGHPDLGGQPLGQPINGHHLVRWGERGPFLVGHDDQRMMVAALHAAFGNQLVGRHALDQLVLDHCVENLLQGQAMLCESFGNVLHGMPVNGVGPI